MGWCSRTRGFATFTAVALVGLSRGSAETQDPQVLVTDPVNVSRNATLSQVPALAVDPTSRIYLAWQDANHLLFATSVDGGDTFSAPVDVITPSPYFAPSEIDVATSIPETVHTVFAGFDESGYPEVFYVRTSDGGKSFARPLMVSTLDAYSSGSPAVDSGWAIGIAWSDVNLDTADARLSYSQSVDGGTTFSPPKTLSDGAEASSPDIVMSGSGTVYVTWSEGVWPDLIDIFFSRSTDGGATFSAPVNVSNMAGTSWRPRLAVDQAGVLYLLWIEGPAWIDRKVYLARSEDGGVSFGVPRVLAEGNVLGASLAVAGSGTVFVTRMTGDPFYSDIDCTLIVSTDGATTFSTLVNIPGCLRVAARTPTEIHLAWIEDPPQQSLPDVFYARAELRLPDTALGFYTMKPCRILDTRNDGPALAAGTTRVFDAAGMCDIPLDAAALALNATTTSATGQGHLRLYPAGGAIPGTSTLNFSAGMTRANNAIVAVGLDGRVAARCVMPPGSTGRTELVVDAFGYFR